MYVGGKVPNRHEDESHFETSLPAIESLMKPLPGPSKEHNGETSCHFLLGYTMNLNQSVFYLLQQKFDTLKSLLFMTQMKTLRIILIQVDP